MSKLMNKNNRYKFIAIIMTVVMTVGVCSVYKENQEVIQAATDAFENSISGFPDSYKTYLRALHKTYPNWKFVPYNTGIDFYTAVSEEAKDNKSLIENAYSKYLKSNASGDYNTSTGKYIPKDGSSWVSASKNCVAYFMDPRNFLDDTHIYMFEQLSYDSSEQTQAGVEAILQGSFMYKTKIGYLTSAGQYKPTSTQYSKQIMDAAKSSKVSAYYIASKILQEIGTRQNSKHAGMGASGSVSGEYSGYEGIYNFYNIGAYSGSNPIAHGLSWASSGTTYQRKWSTPMKSISGGAQYIGEKYINCGQNTTYYQRFNVNKNSTYSLYTHQYMTNICGAASEAANTSEAYISLKIAAKAKTFVIPVYKNMPSESNTVILGNSSSKTGVTTDSVNVRKSPNTTSGIVLTLSKGDTVTVSSGVMTSLSFGTRWLSNPYWYKISVKKNGKSYSGYVAASYVELNGEYNVVRKGKIKLPVTLKTKETVYYMSDNPAIAMVDASGNVTGVSNGSVTIRAFTACGSMSATMVQVLDKGCILDVSSITLEAGKTKTLKSTVYPTNAKNKTVTYSSNKTSVATVSSGGKITAKAPGTATITAKAAVGGAAATCKVTVVQPVTSVKLNKTSIKLSVGNSETLKESIFPTNASNKTVTWKSSNTSVASVSAKGVVTAKAAGVITITATSNNKKTASCKVTVVPAKMKPDAKSNGYNSIKLSWPKTNNITAYWVYKKNSSGKYKIIATVSGSKTYYIDNNLVTGQSYAYKVKAYRTVNKVKYKSAKSKAVKATPVPAKTKITSITKSGNRAALRWKTITGASGYEIYRSESKNGTYKRIKTIKKQSTNSYTNTGLLSGKRYYYKIAAYRKVSGKKVYGSYSTKKSIKM